MDYFDHNPKVISDLREALEYYDEVSPSKGDELFLEFHSTIERIKNNPLQFPPVSSFADLRKAKLQNFPYSLVYRLYGEQFRILTLRHHSRHPNYGLRRK